VLICKLYLGSATLRFCDSLHMVYDMRIIIDQPGVTNPGVGQ